MNTETTRSEAQEPVEVQGSEGGLPGAMPPGVTTDPVDPHVHYLPDEIFFQGKTFADLGLRNSVLKGLAACGFTRPTVIQGLLIPAILRGKDVLGQAKTGTGKTAAFGLPLLHMCDKDVPFQSLVMVPTRELASQVAAEIQQLAQGTPIKVSSVVGGERIAQQAGRLARGPEILVATPGRMLDMLERKLVHLRNLRFAVLDEVDRMLDIGFRDDIRRLLKQCPPNRQTIFVSATIDAEIEGLCRTFSHEAEKFIAHNTTGPLTASVVKQFYLAVQPWDKKRLLLHLLKHEDPDLTVVFCRTKRTVDGVSEYLRDKGIDAHPIHGDLAQGRRNSVMDKLRKGQLSVMVASDVAARGIDVTNISHVVNYDMPDDPEAYVHRIGRTARLGRDGVAWAFVTPEQGPLLTQIEKLINAEVPKLDYPDFKASDPPRGQQAFRGPPAAADPAKAAMYNRYAATVAPPKAATKAAVDTNKFPGGIVPTKAPPKRMFGKVKTTRGMRESIDKSVKSPDAAPGQVPRPQGDGGEVAAAEA
ncbi:MAG: DEAD/DEAH box helicase [Phycisphaerae bacterium]|nr:DEAD/DEAH box helicase [Phycisphaerae bacterium]